MIIELLNDSIAPRVGLRNKPWLHVMMQTQPNERSHGTGIPRASPKAHFVVHLKVTRYAHTYPDGPKPINNALARSCRQRLYGTATRHYGHGVEAVKSIWTLKMTRPYKICLMRLIGYRCGKHRILFALGLVSSASSMGQTMAVKDSVKGFC